MKWLYLLLDLGTLMCPLLLSFDKNVRYFRAWKNALLSAIVIAIPFIIWDILFTQNGFWGFNPAYITGYYLFNLPIEEVLFFIVVPFACTFIYEVVKYFFRSYSFSRFNRIFFFALALYSVSLVILGTPGIYTITVQITAALVLIWTMIQSHYRYIGIAFLFSMIPFLIMNGVLTGCCTPSPIVWYQEEVIVSARIFTIPMEDTLYSFSMIAANILVFEKLQAKKQP